MNYVSKMLVGATAVVSLMIVNAQAFDQAAALADLVNIAKVTIEAKDNLAKASLKGDVDAIAEAQKRSDAVDAAMSAAQNFYSEMEAAIANGDGDAAQSAADKVAESNRKAKDALNGVISKDMESATKEWKTDSTGGSPARPYDPPNIYSVVWDSATMNAFYENQFGALWNSGLAPEDKDATPE